MRYLDTSVLVAALTNEHSTKPVIAWLGNQPAGTLSISGWVVTEFSAALSIKLRSRQLGLEDRGRALAAFARLARNSFRTLTVDQHDFRAAATLSDAYDSGLRAGDALHIAIASTHGAELVTLDRSMAQACAVLGVPALLL